MGFKLNTKEFDNTLTRYKSFSRRDTSTIVNTKGFYIARRAVRETKKADKKKLLADLKSPRLKSYPLKKGGVRNIKYTLAQLLVVSRRAEEGLSTKKSDIKDAVKKLISSRVRAISFLKSGWLPAIKALEPLSEKIGSAPARVDRSVKQYGKPKGEAKPAKENQKVSVCLIKNEALSRDKAGGFLSKIIHLFHNEDKSRVYGIAADGLQKAIKFETDSMLKYIEDKLRRSANKAGIKTN